MASEENVLYLRDDDDNSSSLEDGIWDDIALIKAYDKAVNMAKEQVNKRLNHQVSQDKSTKFHKNFFHVDQKPHQKWNVGDPCRAVYSEDGEAYEANIIKIFEKKGYCIVKFLGYGNCQKVELKDLLQSNGIESRILQEEEGKQDNKAQSDLDTTESMYSSSSKRFGGQVPGEKMDWNQPEVARSAKVYSNGFHDSHPNVYQVPPAPPLPPQLMARLPENDMDALSSMLMSWYISGFHTGYYHGLKQAGQIQDGRKK